MCNQRLACAQHLITHLTDQVRLSPTLTAGLLTETARGGFLPAPAGRIGGLHNHILDAIKGLLSRIYAP